MWVGSNVWSRHSRKNKPSARLALFLFLEGYWSEFKTANLADVLGDLQPAEAGQSSDPAAWHDWLRAVDATKT
jgi:hypothetical protein